ncbi:hypothetical protein [Actinomadura craniellae]|uniref:hypothetical protein n=1 Tax=Actinomadura craniellae TaxID=2231787 RepID=UPI001F462FD7|nr:hypothetical protein [Actinomadura craniellae]
MPADDHAAEVAELRECYPNWSIWFGLFTRRWWALPPRERDIGDFVEAETPQRLVARIEMIQRAPIHPDPWPADPRHPSNLPPSRWEPGGADRPGTGGRVARRHHQVIAVPPA